jgi:putative salt-induced outer membrane protein YdiY
MERLMKQTRIMSVGLSALLLVTCSAAWAQTNTLIQTVPPAGAPVWHGDVAAGLSLARGNANTFLMNASASAENVWDKNDLKLGAEGVYALNNYGQTNQTRAAENVHGVEDYKRLFTDRWYADFRTDLFHDDIALIRYRAIFGPGIGYYFIKSNMSTLNMDVGASYVRQRLDDDGNVGYAALHVGEHGEHFLNKPKTARIWETIQYYPQLTYWHNFLLTAEAGAEAALSTRFSLRVVADDNFNRDPAPGAKENDILLTSQLVYKY